MGLSEIRGLRQRIEALDRERETFMLERDRLILSAIEEGFPVPMIVSASGVTRARIYQIRDLHKEGKS